MRASSKFISREELYDLVWSRSTQVLAKDFGISDVALGKICRKLNIPKPPRGWWARKQAGAQLNMPQLPKASKSQNEGAWITINSKQGTEAVEIAPPTLELIMKLKNGTEKLVVPETLIKPHKLIRQTRQRLRSSKADMYGRVNERWDEDCLDICVAKASLDRAFLFLDTLIKSLEKLSYEVVIRKKHEIATVVRSGKSEIKIKLYERANRFKQDLTKVKKTDLWRYDNYKYEPSGEIELIIERWPLGEQRWKDTSVRTIEKRLNNIVAEIVLSFELIEIESRKRELEHQRSLEKQLASEGEKRRKELEIQRREILEQHSLQWNRAIKIRRFLDACENKLREQGKKLETGSSEAKWLSWARKYADELDSCESGAFTELIENGSVAEY